MKKVYNKDIWRSIWKGKKRFFSILLITALGVTTLTGIKAGCVDLRYSADAFFDKQGLFDISVVSTLGLTEEDILALQQVEGVALAEGAYSEIVHTEYKERRQSAEVKVLSEKGMNIPFIIEGTFPQKANEIAVTEKYIQDTGKKIGDILIIEETIEKTEKEIEETEKETEETEKKEGKEISIEKEEKQNFLITEYQISGIVTDVMDINNPNGSVAFRSSPTADYTFFVLPEAVESDIYTAAYLKLTDCMELLCYSDAYERAVKQVVQSIEEQIKAVREQARYDFILEEANQELSRAEREIEEEFSKAEKELSDAEQELLDGREQLEEGKRELEENQQQAEEELSKAKIEIEDGFRQLRIAENDLTAAEQQVLEGEQQLAQAKEDLTNQQTEANTQLESARTQLEEGIAQIESMMAQFSSSQSPQLQENVLQSEIPDAIPSLSELQAQLQQLSAQLEEVNRQQAETDAQFQAAWQQIAEQEAELYNARTQLESGQAELRRNRTKLEEGRTELAQKEQEVKEQLQEGEQQLKEAEQELLEGTQEWEEGWQEYQEKRGEAEQELEKARKEIAEINKAQWYVQERGSLSGYANIESDADCIEAIGNAFPVIFLIVAVLISLTTITRMIEEDRGLIGTYKALGFTDREIRRKYLVYALAASFLGGIVGDLGGFIVLPEIIFIFFRIMYLLPGYLLKFDYWYGLGGILLFLAGVAGATGYACYAELKQMPAVLMRAKAPQSGSRIILERITPLWNRLSFLNKVTARNLFRYKKRFIMTVSGIMGCTALILCGFAIKDTVTDLMPRQYQHVYRYDLIAAVSSEENAALLSYLKEEEDIADFLNVQIDSIKLKNQEGKEQKIQLIVVPQGAVFQNYIYLENTQGETVELEDNGIYITQNAAELLHLDKNETVFLQNLKLVQKESRAAEIVRNYLGNTIYMTQTAYEELFGIYEPNGALIQLSETCTDHLAFAEELGHKEEILSSVSTEELRRDFSKAFVLMNMIVYVIIFLAAGLAFVVLFTLSATNISERVRELATIKVLGFYDREVHLYVNKETLILTGIGILCGLPLGDVLGHCLTWVLRLPSIYFAVSIHSISYGIAALISFAFALLVDLITNRTLDKVDPVEALKSVE